MIFNLVNLAGGGTNLNWKDMVGNGFYLDSSASESVCALKFVKVDDFVLIDGTFDFINASNAPGPLPFLLISDPGLKPSALQDIHIWKIPGGPTLSESYLEVFPSEIYVVGRSAQDGSTQTIHGCYYLK